MTGAVLLGLLEAARLENLLDDPAPCGDVLIPGRPHDVPACTVVAVRCACGSRRVASCGDCARHASAGRLNLCAACGVRPVVTEVSA